VYPHSTFQVSHLNMVSSGMLYFGDSTRKTFTAGDRFGDHFVKCNHIQDFKIRMPIITSSRNTCLVLGSRIRSLVSPSEHNKIFVRYKRKAQNPPF